MNILPVVAKDHDRLLHLHTEATQLRFFDRNLGIAQVGDGGLGSIYYKFYETQDNGKSWKPLPVTPRTPDTSPGVAPGTFHLSALGGDRMAYFPPSIIVIAYGDMVDEQPRGFVRLSVSADLGGIWRDLKLPVPDKYRDHLVLPFTPIYFDTRNALLPVCLTEKNGEKLGRQFLTFYATDNGGNEWTAQPGIVKCEGKAKDCVVVSPNDIFVLSRTNLQVSHDGARSWQTITLAIDFGREGPQRHVSQFDFVDAKTGWLIISDGSQSLLFWTRDGGTTWSQAVLQIVQ